MITYNYLIITRLVSFCSLSSADVQDTIFFSVGFVFFNDHTHENFIKEKAKKTELHNLDNLFNITILMHKYR